MSPEPRFFPYNFLPLFLWVTPFLGKKSLHGAKKAAAVAASHSHILTTSDTEGKLVLPPRAQIESQVSDGPRWGQMPIPESTMVKMVKFTERPGLGHVIHPLSQGWVNFTLII